ncbi:PQQ-binding-like beta-propeller repeat protein [Kitasatospora viridis]|uniref:Putative pyrroloquinoline-quinone binding quinoprotein n=1 Tax=Kitasatospora viridis TaxID=281105 RepID=A0A561UCY6_9ACTN|nr:PQQ-binding-like beta-propeller repeat protein [Kitasatospora viridis]TWF97208.1 putative pyrroloquinoline-quinone binding quinoprotein [Kitasatospora viridis]
MSQDGYEQQHSWYPTDPQQPPYQDPQQQHYQDPNQQNWDWTAYQEQGHQEQGYQEQGFQAAVEYQQGPGGYQEPAAYQDPTHYQDSTGYQEFYAAPTETMPPVPPVPPAVGETAAAEDPTAEPAVEPAAAPPTRSRRGGSSGSGGSGGSGGSFLDKAKAALLSTDGTPDKRALLIRGAAGIAALGVLITAGVVATSGGDGHHSAAAAPPSSDTGFAVAHTRIWNAQPAAAPQPGTDDTLTGSWLLADAVVRADSSGVHAYDLAGGKPTWSLDAPAQGAVPCGLSPTVNSAGLGGVLFRPAADPKTPCSTLVLVDTKTGKAAWTKQLSTTTNPYAAHVSVLDDKVIAVADDHVAAWAAADGKDLWQYAGPGKYCTLSGGAGPGTVLVHASCADSNPGDQMVALATADGKQLWAHGLDGPPKTATVLSADPVAVLTTGDQPTDAKLLSFDQNGNPTAGIPVVSDLGRLAADTGTFDPVPSIFFQGHDAVSTLTTGDGRTTVVAYDLTSGKASWQTPVPEKGSVRAVALDNGSLVLATEERVGQPAHLSRFALAGGQETAGGNFPPATGSLLSSGRLMIGSDKVVVVPTHSSNFGTATAFQAKG